MLSKGVTLVELIIVVTILATLSIAAFAAFQGTQKNTRDSKRKADITQIAKLYELHYDGLKNEYPILQDDWFAAGRIPSPPEGGLYSGLLTSPSTAGFQICAVLEAGDNFCKQSQGTTYSP